MTRTVVLDNSVEYKQRINICNNQLIIIQKGENLMKTTKFIITMKRRIYLTHDKKLLQNRKL